MKYGESFFDIVYLLFAVISGLLILQRRRDRAGKLMGAAVLILGCGDAFHLVPRVLHYFSDADLSAWMGFGKLVTSVTMTVFYVLLYRLWLVVYKEPENPKMSRMIYALAAIRILLCLLPQNRWLENESSVLWGTIRNIPFVILGAADIWLYYRKRSEEKRLRSVWLLILLSFLFYIPVAVGAGILPMLGMLMLPKTVCYMILIWIFLKF